jgi:cell division protein FtsL
MEEMDYKKMVHAFVAGCLEKDELIQFKNHMSSDESNSVEIGELQNVVCLLPAILELEHPRPGLKDKIAKRLQKISEEIMEKKKQEEAAKQPVPEPTVIEEPVIEESAVEEPVVEDTNVEEEKIVENQPVENELVEEKPVQEENIEADQQEFNYEKFLVDESQFKELQEKIDEEFANLPPVIEPEIPVTEEKEKPSYTGSEPYRQKEEIIRVTKKESRLGLYILIIIMFLISLAVAAVVYFINNSEIQNNKKQIALLNGQVSALNSEILRLNRIQRILYIIGSKDVSTINLNGTGNNPAEFGKLSLDFPSKEGLLQLFNMPALTSNQYYHLWMTGNGQTFSLGSYRPAKNGEYLTINQMPEIPMDDIESFQVTIEENQNPTLPSRLQLLSASLKNSARRR